MLKILTQADPFPSENFPKGAVLLVDKPLAWTSFDAVKKVRWLLCQRLGTKKLKIGHAGTLDPLATGLLILCVGDYTKRIESFQDMAKTYTGTITLGATTPSFDLEKAVDTVYPTEHLTPALLESARQQFIGEIQQVPPMFSAIKVDGKRMYKNARTGEQIEMEPRSVHIHSFDISDMRPVSEHRSEPINISKKGTPIMLHPDSPTGIQVDFETSCSKGTYIRSLAYDFGQAVGSGAYLSGLRRTRIGDFSVEGAWKIEELIEWIAGK